MIVGIIASSFDHQVNALLERYTEQVDLFEWRLDYLQHFDWPTLQRLRACFQKPVIFTLRPQNQNGHYHEPEEARLSLLFRLAALKPDYMDLEHTIPSEWISALHANEPSIHLMRSYHHFENTPSDLDSVLSQLRHPACQSYKVIGTAQSALDVIHVMSWLKERSQTVVLTAHCMGELGFFSRIISPIVGGRFQYVQLEEGPQPAPGCLMIQEALTLYRLPYLNRDTEIFALLGHPVSHSIGHFYHNAVFQQTARNAVYVKIDLSIQEIAAFFDCMRSLPFRGFSVTMPLKEAIIPWVEADASGKKMGAVNTIGLTQGRALATNTDAAAVWDISARLLMQSSLSGKSVLILGAGGSARALGCTARHYGIERIVIVNRTLSSAQQLATFVHGEAYDFNTAQHIDLSKIDLVISTLPISAQELIEHFQSWQWSISPNHVLMQLRYDDSSFETHFRKKWPGIAVDGYLMFKAQAALQQKFWQTVPGDECITTAHGIKPEDILPGDANTGNFGGTEVRKGSVAAFLANVEILESPNALERAKEGALIELKKLAPKLIALNLHKHAVFKNSQIEKILVEAEILANRL